jgi:hypothetical protein
MEKRCDDDLIFDFPPKAGSLSTRKLPGNSEVSHPGTPAILGVTAK